MLIRFSVIIMGGIEVIFWQDEKTSQQKVYDEDLFSGFMEALQSISQEMGKPIRELQLSNLMLYIRTYGDFSIRILMEEKVQDSLLDTIFNQVSKETVYLLAKMRPGEVINLATMPDNKILPILAPLIPNMAASQTKVDPPQFPVTSKIAICGLAHAGKTSIKNMFFDKMTQQVARDTKPTIGVDMSRKFSDFLSQKLLVMDVGGQDSYRKQALNKDEYWVDIAALIFVVDLQNPQLLKKLENIWPISGKKSIKSMLSCLNYRFCCTNMMFPNGKNCYRRSIMFYKSSKNSMTMRFSILRLQKIRVAM